MAAELGHQGEALRFEASLGLQIVFEVAEVLLGHLDPPGHKVFLYARLVSQQFSLANEVILRTSAQLERHLLLFLQFDPVSAVASGLPTERLLQPPYVLVPGRFLRADNMGVQGTCLTIPVVGARQVDLRLHDSLHVCGPLARAKVALERGGVRLSLH